MDTSEQYTKMCDCEEIQKLWSGKQGDFHKYFGISAIATLHTNFEPTWLRKHSIWLPRQDQLQEMVDGGFTHQSFERFYHWYQSGICQYPSSMEQLWLAFVMKEKFDKTREGDKWV